MFSPFPFPQLVISGTLSESAFGRRRESNRLTPGARKPLFRACLPENARRARRLRAFA
jgi:hypothetical protein